MVRLQSKALKKGHAIFGVAKLLGVRSVSSEARIVAGTTILPRQVLFMPHKRNEQQIIIWSSMGPFVYPLTIRSGLLSGGSEILTQTGSNRGQGSSWSTPT